MSLKPIRAVKENINNLIEARKEFCKKLKTDVA